MSPITRLFSTNIEKQSLFIINGKDQDLVVVQIVKLIYWTNITSLLIIVTK